MKANGGVVIANPNAPTSLFTETAELEKVVAANPDSVVIIDEAYVDFAKDSMLSYIDKYDNLLVVRTYSKSRSLAGLRIGYAIGNKELINALNSVKLSYNSYTMNMPSQIMGAAAIADNDYFEATVEKIIATREATSEKLKEMGFKVLPSSTNFLFVSHKDVPAEYIFEELRKDNIYVRYFKKPKINNFLRITIGTDEEMEIFLKKVLTTLK